MTAALFAGLASGGSTVPAGAAPEASVRLEPLASRVDWSDGSFSIRIELSDFDHQGSISYDDDRDTVPDREEPSIGLGAYEILLHFDPAVLEVASAEAGDVFEGSARSPQCLQRSPRRGQFAVGCVTTGTAPGPQGSGTLATITLTPLANGTTFLALEAQLGGPLADSIPVTATGGIVEVFGAPQTAPTPTPGSPTDGDGPGPGDGDGDGDGSEPTVIGGGEPGEVDPPPGEVRLPPTGASGEGFPSAGTGYQPPDSTSRPLVLGGALALAGAALLLLGSRLSVRARRS